MPEHAHEQRSPVRSFWSGTITFGLVSIPVDLFAAVRPRRTSMKLVDAKGHPLGREYYSEHEEDGVPPENIVRGYETDDGEMVVVTDEELDAIAPEMSRDIELRTFVPREQIAPAYYQRPYFLAPSGRSQKAYQLLAETMHEAGRVGIGTFVMRGHQYLVALLSDGRLLRAETLRFAAELRSPKDIGLPERAKPDRRELKRMSDAVAALTRDELDMNELSDRYAGAIQELVQAKVEKGKDIIESFAEAEPEEEAEDGAEVIDLVKLLRERVGAKVAAPKESTVQRDNEGDGLRDLSKHDLYERAQALDIPGRSRMGKGELIRAIERAQS